MTTPKSTSAAPAVKKTTTTATQLRNKLQSERQNMTTPKSTSAAPAVKKTTTTATQLRNKLLEVFDDLGANKIQAGKAKELSNAAGKIIASVKVQLEYASLRKERPSIPFCK